ncbi:MAG: hypothetical protein R3E97_10700 [Candidatus Eisenbacteria bacterium]
MRLQLETAGPVELAIFDLTGRRVATLLDQVVAAGAHQVGWDGRDGQGEARERIPVALVQGDSVSTEGGSDPVVRTGVGEKFARGVREKSPAMKSPRKAWRDESPREVLREAFA